MCFHGERRARGWLRPLPLAPFLHSSPPRAESAAQLAEGGSPTPNLTPPPGFSAHSEYGTPCMRVQAAPNFIERTSSLPRSPFRVPATDRAQAVVAMPRARSRVMCEARNSKQGNSSYHRLIESKPATFQGAADHSARPRRRGHPSARGVECKARRSRQPREGKRSCAAYGVRARESSKGKSKG